MHSEASDGADFAKKGDENQDLYCDFHQGPTMRDVANLVIALPRMKNTCKRLGTEFSDYELINIMEDALVEDVVLKLMGSTTSRTNVLSLSGTKEYNISDQNQKSLVVNQEARELLAVTLQGGSMDQKVRLNLCMYVSPNSTDTEGRPSVLGIAGSSLYLRCSMSSGKSILQLEEIENKEKLERISSEGDMRPFLFFRKDRGFSMSTFESAVFPGWYIGTAKGERKPVKMCLLEEPGCLTSFMLT